MILVTGATGTIGKELVPTLVNADQQVRALVRDIQKVAHLDPCIERATGDLDKPETLQAALKGVDRIFLVTYETPQDINVLKAAKDAGVNHLVKLSTLEASRPYLMVAGWHREREELIKASGLGWTFLLYNKILLWQSKKSQKG